MIENDVVCVITVEVDKNKPSEDKEKITDINNKNKYILRNKVGVSFKAITVNKNKPKFSYSYLISSLVELVVVFQITYSITTFVALYLLGSDSEINWKYAIKDCNMQRDLVKYTLKTIIDTQIFKSIDCNALFKDELICLLHESFSKCNSEYHGFRDSNDETALTDEEINIMVDNIMKYAKPGDYDEYCITFSQVMDIIYNSNVEIIKSIKKKANKNYCYCCCCKNLKTYNKNIVEIRNEDDNLMSRLVEEGRKISNEKPKRKPHHPVNPNDEGYGFRSRNASMSVRFDGQRSRIKSEGVKNTLELPPTPTATDNENDNNKLDSENNSEVELKPPQLEQYPSTDLTANPLNYEPRQRRQRSVNLDDVKIMRSPPSSFYKPAGVGGPTGSFHNITTISSQSPSLQAAYRKSYRKNDNSFQKTKNTPNSPENTVRSRQRLNSRKVNLGVEGLVLPPLSATVIASMSPSSEVSVSSSTNTTPKHKDSSNQSKNGNEEGLIKNDEETRKLSHRSHSHHHHHRHHNKDNNDNDSETN